MSYDVEKRKEDLLEISQKKGLEEILRPLVREIHLFDTMLSGTVYIEDTSVFEALKENEKLLLQREVTKFDADAVAVLNQNHQKIGCLPEKDSPVFSRLMDAGKLLNGRVISVFYRDGFYRVKIGIWLMDY
jgi:hypothetical protein